MIGGLPGGQYKPLSPEGIKDIHNTSLRLLENVGMEVNCKEALDIFKEKGAGVDFDKHIVEYPVKW